MKPSLLPILVPGLIILAIAPATFAQPAPGQSPWRAVDRLPQGLPPQARWVDPPSFRPVALDHEAMRRQLGAAPPESARVAPALQAVITLAMPDGTEQRFRVVEAPVMAPELAARYPEIKTYLGQGLDDARATVRLDLTPAGFHAQILSPFGAVYIDPHLRDRSIYASYYKRDYRRLADEFQCATVAADLAQTGSTAVEGLARSGGNLRTYRLACATTGEYTAFHGGTVSNGLAAVVTAINRVNGVYETELAIRMQLVANNHLIIYTNAATDPYSNTSGSTMLTQNQTTLDAVIGSGNYDIGHVFSTGGGGIAGLGVVCVNGSKARGVTGNGSPTGDSFWIDYVAHEIGHQFGGNHTFNSTTGNCGGGNRNASTAYEQGSGSTIMAYAGICSTDDLQPHSDPYFHSASFDEIVNFSTGGAGNSCAVVTSTGNAAPSVSAGPNYTIPQNTPFTLTASGSDPDGDSLTYCWEERDLGAATTVTDPDNGSSPLFRSFNPTSSPSRTFPRLQELLNNTLPKGEIMPTTTRTLNFRVTARDNQAGGGGVNTSDMQVSVVAEAGPFLVTSHNGGGVYSNQTTVTWNVAGTAAAPVNAASVNILLSTNGGLSFPITLAAGTPNDGSQMVLLPNLNSTAARIKVAAAGNIFFDIGNASFNLVPGVPMPAVVIESATLVAETCSAPNNAIDPGETVTVDVVLQNIGSAATTNLVATLLATNGVTLPSFAQDFGALAANGGSAARSFTFVAEGSCGGSITPTLQLQDGTASLGTLVRPFNLGTFVAGSAGGTNPASISIPANGKKGKAGPFPSTITVAGVTGTVSKVAVTLAGFNHEWPADVDVLLVGPAGQTLLLISDAGEGNFPVSGLTFTFDDDAPSFMPGSSPLVSGTFKPTNYDTTDTFSSPAPAGPYGGSLSVFNGTDPNGPWSLYIEDDGLQDTGAITQGWSIHFTTLVPDCCAGAVTPLANLAIGLQPAPALVNVGSNLTFSVSVTNLGPDTASGVTVTNFLPAGLEFVSAIASQGSPTNVDGLITCDLGSLADGDIATLMVEAWAVNSGAATNVAVVTAATLDSTPGNNTASAPVLVNAFPTISAIGPVATNEDQLAGPIPFIVGDAETPSASLTLEAGCSDTNLLPLANIVFGGSDSNRTVTLSPATNQSGSATILIVVSDGMASSSATFEVTFEPVNDAPILAAIPDRTVHAGALIQFTNAAIDVDDPANDLSFALGPGAPVNAAIDSASGVFTWLTADEQAGTTNAISVEVIDDGSPALLGSNTFEVIVVSRPMFYSIETSNAVVTLRWSAIDGQGYRLQTNGTLPGQLWGDFGADVLGIGPSAATTGVVDQAEQYYRVRVLP